jgi:hypothetical protein
MVGIRQPSDPRRRPRTGGFRVGACRPDGEGVCTMRAFRFRLAVLGLAALAALLALPGGALAAKPVFHDKIDVTIEDIDLCGETVDLHVTGTQVGSFSGDTFKVTGQVTQVFTTDDGRSVTLSAAGPFTSTFTDNGDGTFTIVDTWKGLPEKISGATGGPVLRDAGLISFVVTIDEDGNVLDEDVIVHGPHPEADSGFTAFCDAVLAALG